MRADISRLTFDPSKRYQAVVIQQGRPITDADLNEAQLNLWARLHEVAAEVIGGSGAPKHNGGFAITPSAGNFVISHGRFSVEGVLVQNLTDLFYNAQLEFPGAVLPPPDGAGLYVVYLDVWDRHRSAADDPAIREVALGGPDTSGRLRRTWQVRIQRVSAVNAAPDCAAVIAAWRATLANIATLTARTVIPPPTTGPCALPDTAGFRGLENQLYRVEVHTGADTRAQARFKWSRVNASIETGITAFATAAVTVRDLGRDDILGFRDGQWAEIVDDHSELLAQSGQLVQLGPVNPDTNTISIRSSTPFSPVPLNRHPKLRRWDQSGSAATTAGVSATQFPSSTEFGFALEDGIEVVLSEGRYRAGDYWLIPARTAVTSDTGDIEWPLNGGGNRLPLPPHGIEHRLAPLALLNFNGATFSAPPSGDCRTIFPPLTDIDAADVGFDNTNCQLANANTVQQAIDALCARHEECCSLVVTPGPQWTDALAPLADEAVIHLCFRPGEYRLDAPLVFRDKTAVRISGCGPGTRIVCPTSESALILERCASVTFRDLHVEAGLVGTQRPDLEHLNGALTCIDCSRVTVEHASFACSNGAIRAAACLVVRNAPPRDLGSSARVTGCTFDIGYNQLGLLVLGAARSAIEGNHVLGRVVSQPNWDVLLEDPDLRARLRHEILHHSALSAVAGSGRAQVTFAGQAVSFLTAPTLVAAWQKLVSAAPPATISSAADLLRHVKRLAVRVLRDPVLRAQVPEFGAWLNSMRAATPAIAGQGIVVGGGLSEEARILNNSITGVQEGVHVGLSTAAAQPGPARSFGALVIQGNRIDVNVVAGGLRDYGGIFVGNSRSTVIESNTLQLTRFPFSSKPVVFGMRIHGELGRMLAVRQNLMTAFTIGITVTPVRPAPQTPLWFVTDNMASGAQRAVEVAPGITTVRQSFNLT